MRLGQETLTVRPLRRRDVGAVMAIERVSYPKPWSENVVRTEIQRAAGFGDRSYLAATIGRSLVGYAGLMFAADDAHITNIAVAPDRRRSGIATRLMVELGWAARAKGAQAMTLEVRDSNLAAQRLYESFGFEVAGIRRKYYENTDDALVMWRHGVAGDEFADVLRHHAPQAER